MVQAFFALKLASPLMYHEIGLILQARGMFSKSPTKELNNVKFE
jgi:hypothetical protein